MMAETHSCATLEMSVSRLRTSRFSLGLYFRAFIRGKEGLPNHGDLIGDIESHIRATWSLRERAV
jgi:hypothetical protein